jgi:hypothetical protein
MRLVTAYRVTPAERSIDAGGEDTQHSHLICPEVGSTQEQAARRARRSHGTAYGSHTQQLAQQRNNQQQRTQAQGQGLRNHPNQYQKAKPNSTGVPPGRRRRRVPL